MIYLDHHAASPLAPAVKTAIAEAYAQNLGNPASVHRAGQRARALVESARQHVAEAIGAHAVDVLFAGTGSEACNLALLGIARPRLAQAKRVITTPIEHPAVLAAAHKLAAEGAALVFLPLTDACAPPAALLTELLRVPTACVCVQWVNHETGTLFPVADYAEVCAAAGVPLVIDASQAVGKLAVDVRQVPCSALVVASSKLGGPAGVSALWHARCEALEPVVVGGGQERGLRPGTPDVAALAGFGEAARAIPERIALAPFITRRRDRIEAALLALGAVVNGAEGPRVGCVSNVSFAGLRSDVLVAALDVEGLCVSAGAACSSGVAEPSPVLRALYADAPWRAAGALRFSLGPSTTDDEIDEAIAIVTRVLERVRRPRA